MIARTYNLTDEQKALIEMAYELNKPLLVSGKPGTGKTQMAHSFAAKNEQGVNLVFQFNTKSNSAFTDILYSYDAIGHFRTTRMESEKKKVENFIKLEALGKAIVLAKGIESDVFQTEEWQTIIKNSFRKEEIKAVKTIVLIDEIDKAPRDFPNDLLNEMDNYEFTIKEIENGTISFKNDLDKKKNILVILTSNDEKNLPDAFLRRCLFYYILPPDITRLTEIVNEKLTNNNINISKYQKSETWLDEKMKLFNRLIENQKIEKKPSTAECIEWIVWLSNKDNTNENLKRSLNILFKKVQDQELANAMLNQK